MNYHEYQQLIELLKHPDTTETEREEIRLLLDMADRCENDNYHPH